MNHINFYIKILSALFVFASFFNASASSHREAPFIANDPLADNTDLYAFRSPTNTDKIILIATYVPMQDPQSGPNYNSFGENIRYEIHIENDGTSGDDITYRFTFSKQNQDPTTFFNIRLGQQNLKTTYTLEKSINGGAFTSIVTNGIVPPPNIGNRSIQSPTVGLGAANYDVLINNAITTASSGERVFCGTSDDPYFADLGGIFDLGNSPRQVGNPKDGLRHLNVSTIAIEVDIASLQKYGQTVSNAVNILDSDYIIGVWASASRQQTKTINPNGDIFYSGNWIQVSRIGMPLTNQIMIPLGQKDHWNSLTPYTEEPAMESYFNNPELGLYMDNSLFGGAFPAMSGLRIQRNSLQSFDFGNTNDGLWPIRASNGGAGTALDTNLFGNYLLRQGNPRSFDLLPIFYTGLPNLSPYHLATGKSGNPLAVGKPFINNFLPTFGDMLRLNMAVPPTPRNDPNFSSLGIIQAAVLGLTTAPYNTNSVLEFIPNMDGFPNGRRLEDDVVRIELQTISGVFMAAIGLWYDDYAAGGPNPITQELLSILSYTTGVENNDTTFKSSFPFVQTPWAGTASGDGMAIAYTQPTCLTISVPLPLNIVSFEVEKQNRDALLEWSISNSENVFGFEVEQSTNAVDFQKIGFVKNGTNNHYQYTDKSLKNGKYYYRLKVVDEDKRFMYSKVETIIFSDKDEISIYPNPVSDELFINSFSNSFSYNIVDIYGKKIKQGNSNSSKTIINMKSFSSGFYYLNIEVNNEIKTFKIFKK